MSIQKNVNVHFFDNIYSKPQLNAIYKICLTLPSHPVKSNSDTKKNPNWL